MAKSWKRSEISKVQRPTPINFRSNSVHFDRARAATVARKSEYASICSRKTDDELTQVLLVTSLPFMNVLFTWVVQIACACPYTSATCSKSSLGNPMTDDAEYKSMYLFTYKEKPFFLSVINERSGKMKFHRWQIPSENYRLLYQWNRIVHWPSRLNTPRKQSGAHF